MKKKPRRSYKRVTRYQVPFPLFVRYILDEANAHRQLDMHWWPAHDFCSACAVNFTAIVRFETFDRDQNYVLAKAGLLDSGLVVKEINRAKDGKDTIGLVDNYMDLLDDDAVRGLCDMYRVDFDIFGYSYHRCKW